MSIIVGVPRLTIQKIRVRMNLLRTPQNIRTLAHRVQNTVSDEARVCIIELHKQGVMSVRDIAETVNVPPRTVLRVIRKVNPIQKKQIVSDEVKSRVLLMDGNGDKVVDIASATGLTLDEVLGML